MLPRTAEELITVGIINVDGQKNCLREKAVMKTSGQINQKMKITDIHCPDFGTPDGILLRNLKNQDLEAFTGMRNDKRIYRCEPTFLAELQGKPECALRAVMNMDFIRDRQFINGIYETADPDVLIGLAEFYDYKASGKVISIGYRIRPEYWGHGIGSLTVHAMLDFIKDNTEVELVTAHVMPENKASSRCLLKNGFEYLITKQEDWGHGKLTIVDVYTYDC